MSPALDEPAAWRAVMAVGPAATGSRVELGEVGAGAWLEVDGAGGWSASVEVEGSARDILDMYLPLRVRAEFVVGQLGQSIDGRIATESGASHYVTGREDIERLHRLRALADAVVVGAGTVAADDPRLTVRLVEGPDPVRVVLDPERRLEDDRRVFSDGEAPTLLVRAQEVGSASPAISGVEEVAVPLVDPGRFDLAALLDVLRSRGLTRVLVEGGGVTVSRFVQAGLLDRLHVTVAPVLIGSGRPSLTLDPIETLDRALRPRCRQFRLGADVLFDFDFRAEP